MGKNLRPSAPEKSIALLCFFVCFRAGIEIFEEMVEYSELSIKSYSKYMNWKIIRSLLKLAFVNEKLTEQ